jgi:hypothetical protein
MVASGAGDYGNYGNYGCVFLVAGPSANLPDNIWWQHVSHAISPLCIVKSPGGHKDPG